MASPDAGRPSHLREICIDRTFFCMKTTLNFDDRLIRDAKSEAAARGETLTSLIEQALRAFLRRPAGRKTPFRLTLLTKSGQPVAGINWDDRDSICGRIEET